MNVALEPASTIQPSDARVPAPDRVGQHSEWIDPEGDDWFACVYRELTQEPPKPTVDQPSPELVHWFG